MIFSLTYGEKTKQVTIVIVLRKTEHLKIFERQAFNMCKKRNKKE